MAEIFLTADGYKELEEKLNLLKSVKRAEISEKIRIAREFGDISENAEYDSAKDEQALIEGEILEIEAKLTSAKIIADVVDTKVVSLGTKITVENQATKEKLVYQIVGTSETDPFSGRISNESPIGAGLLGKKINQVAEIALPNKKKISLKVLSIKKG